MSRTWVQHTVGVPLAAARRTLPRSVDVGAASLQLDAVEGNRVEGRWRSGRAGGDAVVELSSLARGVTQIDLCLRGSRDQGRAEQLGQALCRGIEPRPAVAAGGSHRPTRGALIGGVAGVLVLVTALAASRLLAPPPPMALDDAVAAYRTPPPVASSTDPTAHTRSDGGGDDAGNVTQRRRAQRQRGEGRPTSARTDRAAPPAAPQGRRRGADRQRVAAVPSRQSRQRPQERRTIQPGVYTYATSGYEEIDRPSSRHTYPSQTPLTVRRADCGFSSRWQPFEHRWDQMDLCVGQEGALLQRMATNREFYGQRQNSTYECVQGSIAWRHRPGATWQFRCSDGESTIAGGGRSLRPEPITVGGETIEAVRFVIQGRISGENNGSMRIERWVDPETGLLLRLEGRTEATSPSSIGQVQYREELSLRLESTTPRT